MQEKCLTQPGRPVSHPVFRVSVGHSSFIEKKLAGNGDFSHIFINVCVCICVCVLPAFMSIHHVHAWYSVSL